MNIYVFRSRVRNICVATAASGIALVALASPECYKTIDLSFACSLGDGCDTYNYCGDPPTVHSNEMVKTTQTNGNRQTSVDLDFLCHKTWKEVDPETSLCNVPRSCDYTIQGKVASGSLCVGGGGGGQ